MTQWVKVFSTNPNKLSLISWTHVVKGKNELPQVLSPPHEYLSIHKQKYIHTYSYAQIIMIKIKSSGSKRIHKQKNRKKKMQKNKNKWQESQLLKLY